MINYEVRLTVYKKFGGVMRTEFDRKQFFKCIQYIRNYNKPIKCFDRGLQFIKIELKNGTKIFTLLTTNEEAIKQWRKDIKVIKNSIE